MKFSKKQIKKLIIESLFDDPSAPGEKDFFNLLNMFDATRTSIRHVYTSEIWALRSSDYSLVQSFQELHRMTQQEMLMSRENWFVKFSNQIQGCKSPIESEKVLLDFTSEKDKDKYLNYNERHATPPGAIINYNYPNNQNLPNEYVMDMYIRNSSSPKECYDLIKKDKNNSLNPADRAEVGYAGFLAKFGFSNVTHTSSERGVDVIANYAEKKYKFEVKKSNDSTPTREYNTTPVFVQDDKFYIFSCTNKSYIIRSDILAIFERTSPPLKREKGIDSIDPSPEDVTALMPILNLEGKEGNQIIVDLLGNSEDSIKYIVADMIQNPLLSSVWDSIVDIKGTKNDIGTHILKNKINNEGEIDWNSLPRNQRKKILDTQNEIRLLVVSIGIPVSLQELSDDYFSKDNLLTDDQIKKIIRKINISGELHRLKNQSAFKVFKDNNEKTFWHNHDIFKFAHYVCANKNIDPSDVSKTIIPTSVYKKIKSQKLRIGEKYQSDSLGASMSRTKILAPKGTTDRSIINYLKDDNISSLEKSIVIKNYMKNWRRQGITKNSAYQKLKKYNPDVFKELQELIYNLIKKDSENIEVSNIDFAKQPLGKSYETNNMFPFANLCLQAITNKSFTNFRGHVLEIIYNDEIDSIQNKEKVIIAIEKAAGLTSSKEKDLTNFGLEAPTQDISNNNNENSLLESILKDILEFSK